MSVSRRAPIDVTLVAPLRGVAILPLLSAINV